MRKISMIVAALSVVSVATLVGCKKDGTNSQGTNVKMMLTDAPGDFDAVYIDVEAIRVHTDAQGWVTYNSNLGVINILDYTNGESTLLANVNLEANAHVNQIRLILGSDNSVVVDGQTFALSTPSAQQSGLKINLDHTFSGGGDFTWTLDFDAAQSVVAQGNGGYQLKPVVRLIVDNETAIALNNNGGGSGSVDIDLDNDGIIDIDADEETAVIINGSVTGNISGSINNIGGLAVVTATQISGSGSGSGGGMATVSTVTALSGNFNLSAMSAGTYTITIDPLIPLLQTRTMESVTVTGGQTTNLGLVAL